MQWATPGDARDFTICSRSGRGVNPHDLGRSDTQTVSSNSYSDDGIGAVEKEAANIRPDDKTLICSTYVAQNEILQRNFTDPIKP
jgi:hypothetical protein